MLTTAERRLELFHRLQKETKPISGTDLGKLFSVSRQIIVGDIGILRARGIQVTSTPRGYILDEQMVKNGTLEAIDLVYKTTEDLEKLLNVVIENEGCIRDVVVNHGAYGELRQSLMIRSVSDVQRYLDKLKSTNSKPLAALVDGKATCTIEARDSESMDVIKKALAEAKILK